VDWRRVWSSDGRNRGRDILDNSSFQKSSSVQFRLDCNGFDWFFTKMDLKRYVKWLGINSRNIVGVVGRRLQGWWSIETNFMR
jgi:hypothetical protein